MSEVHERVCRGCGAGDTAAMLEHCGMCRGYFCADCAHRAGHGRRFCSPECARAYYFTGEPDDDDDPHTETDE